MEGLSTLPRVMQLFSGRDVKPGSLTPGSVPVILSYQISGEIYNGRFQPKGAIAAELQEASWEGNQVCF